MARRKLRNACTHKVRRQYHDVGATNFRKAACVLNYKPLSEAACAPLVDALNELFGAVQTTKVISYTADYDMSHVEASDSSVGHIIYLPTGYKDITLRVRLLT